MKSPLFKDNVEDNEIRFKVPEDVDVVEGKSSTNKNRYDNAFNKEVNNGR